MAIRKANAVWNGGLQDGKGTVKLGSGAFEGQYSFSSRFEEGVGTNPEELLGERVDLDGGEGDVESEARKAVQDREDLGVVGHGGRDEADPRGADVVAAAGQDQSGLALPLHRLRKRNASQQQAERDDTGPTQKT